MFTLAIIIVFIVICAGTFNSWSTSEFFQSDKLQVIDITGNKPGPFICLVAGTHGNEPAGTKALYDLLKSGDGTLSISSGHLRIIPCVNEWGYNHNMRHNRFFDINRGYTASGGTDWITKNVIGLTKGADMVIDFHEGWGYHRCQPDSVGSTLTPTTDTNATALSTVIVNKINESGAGGCRQFMVLADRSCDITT